MAPSAGLTTLIVLSVIAVALVATIVTLYVTQGEVKPQCTPRSTFCGSRAPTCDYREYQKDAKLPLPSPGVSAGYDWVAANYALNLFGEGARAYVLNLTPQAFPHTKTLGVLSGVDVPDPTSVKKRRLHNIAWVVKVAGVKGAADQIYIVWRGTQSDPEWGVNLDMRLVPWHPDYKGVLVHQGFDKALKEVRGELYALLKKHVTKPDNTVVYVTGLSLGGGLSTVAAADLVTRSNLGLKDVRLYAFSAPRTGNKAFVEMMKGANAPGGALVDMFTIVNAKDMIPTTPSNVLGYEPMPSLTFSADWGDGSNNHLMAVQFAHLDRVYQKCPAVEAPPDTPV
jgi:hypothetical protein